MDETKLQLATHKTEAIILKGKPRRRDVYLEFEMVQIFPKKTPKILRGIPQRVGILQGTYNKINRESGKENGCDCKNNAKHWGTGIQKT